MQHKGYDVELVVVNFEVWETGDTGEIKCLDRLKEMAQKPSVLLDRPEGTLGFPLKYIEQNKHHLIVAEAPFGVYDFTMISVRDFPILPEMVDNYGLNDCLGPGSVFWERLIQCRDKACDGQIGTFVSVWAVDEHATYVECGDGDVCGETEYDLELVGFIGPDMQVVEVGFGWPPKTDAYDYYVACESTTDPTFGLQIYLCGFDYQTAVDEVMA